MSALFILFLSAMFRTFQITGYTNGLSAHCLRCTKQQTDLAGQILVLDRVESSQNLGIIQHNHRTREGGKGGYGGWSPVAKWFGHGNNLFCFISGIWDWVSRSN